MQGMTMSVKQQEKVFKKPFVGSKDRKFTDTTQILHCHHNYMNVL